MKYMMQAMPTHEGSADSHSDRHTMINGFANFWEGQLARLVHVPVTMVGPIWYAIGALLKRGCTTTYTGAGAGCGMNG